MRTTRKNENLENSESAMSQAPGNGTSGGKSPGNAGSSSLAHGATGPRSLAGKKRSSRNSIKHRILSSALHLGEKDAKLYRSLLKALNEFYDPQDMEESLWVEMLAINYWHRRCLLEAYSAETLKCIDHAYVEKARAEDTVGDFGAMMDEYMARTDKKGLIVEIDDSTKLEHCLDLLRGIQMEQLKWGFDCDHHWIPLARVYGTRYEGRPGKDLLDFYLDCRKSSYASEEERKKKGFASEQDCLQQFSAELDREIRRLEVLRREPSVGQRSPRKLKPFDVALLACKIPDSPALDRLVRYEVGLDRQLERLQRTRPGQPVPPRIDVNLSTS